MALPVPLDVAPMLARLARTLPTGDVLYEPKWDGFRCLAFRDGDAVELRSRHARSFTRYFPEVVEGLRALDVERAVLDGELLVERDGVADFEALLLRLHPSASRVARLRAETPAELVVFDVLAVDDDDLRSRPLGERRAVLEQVLAGARPPIRLCPATTAPTSPERGSVRRRARRSTA